MASHCRAAPSGEQQLEGHPGFARCQTRRVSKHLILSGGSENWRLSEATNLDELRKAIEESMSSREILQLPVLLPDRPEAPVTLLLNCRAAPSVVLVEL